MRVAAAEMAGAVRVVTVERGIDPRELALVAFGGAGPLHAVEIAEELEMRRVVVPTAGGVLSALGLVLSERRRDVVESVLLTGADLTDASVGAAVDRMGADARTRLGDPAAELRVTHDLRYAGQAFELPVEAAPGAGVDRAAAGVRARAPEPLRAHVPGDGAGAGHDPGHGRAARSGGPRARRRRRPRTAGTRPVVFGGEPVEARVLGPGAARCADRP